MCIRDSRCTIVTPEEQVLDESLTQAILPAHDGLLGILTDRAPLLAKLRQGPLRVDLAAGGSRHYYIEGGIAQMKDNNLTILTNQATPANEIDAEAGRGRSRSWRGGSRRDSGIKTWHGRLARAFLFGKAWAGRPCHGC